VSMPAVTIKFDRTKHDILKGRKTGSPVSVSNQHLLIFFPRDKRTRMES
jgi:hypothetical protein